MLSFPNHIYPNAGTTQPTAPTQTEEPNDVDFEANISGRDITLYLNPEAQALTQIPEVTQMQS